MVADSSIVHGGNLSVRFDRSATSPEKYSNIGKFLPMDFPGKTVELRGYLRTVDVKGTAGLLVREDDDGGSGVPLAFATMEKNRPVSGTAGWTEYSIALPIDSNATRLWVGVILSGTGTLWAEDLSVWVDGKPLTLRTRRS